MKRDSDMPYGHEQWDFVAIGIEQAAISRALEAAFGIEPASTDGLGLIGLQFDKGFADNAGKMLFTGEFLLNR